MKKITLLALAVLLCTVVFASGSSAAVPAVWDGNIYGFPDCPDITMDTAAQYQYLAFAPISDGTVYFYYTNDVNVPDAAAFRSIYASDSTVYKGSTPARGGHSMSAPLFPHMQVCGCTQLAVMMEDSTGTAYAPFLLPTPPFILASYTLYSMERHQIEFTVNQNGRMYYCLTDSPETADTAVLIGQILAGSPDPGMICGYTDAAANRQAYVPLSFSSADTVPEYAMLILEDEDGFVHAPVILPTDGSAESNGAITGFSGIPTLKKNDEGIYILSCSGMQAGTVYYYYSNDGSTPADPYSFMTAGQASVSGMQSFRVGIGTTSIPMPGASRYPYVVLMFSSSTGGYYRPVLVQLKDNTPSKSDRSHVVL